MNKLKTWLIILLVSAAVILVGLFLIGVFSPKGAGIYIETSPASTVFIEEVQVGKTPYRAVRKPGEVIVKLTPELEAEKYSPFEVKVTLLSGIETVIKREFGEKGGGSSGETVSFERIGGSEASLAIVSVPDAAEISIDGQIRGFSPYKINSILPRDHQLVVSAPNYVQRDFSVKTLPGYKLTAFVELAPKGEIPTETPSPSPFPPTDTQKPYVEILETSTGFLRVRAEPTTSAKEVAQVTPGKKYLLLETDSKSGWYKIEYQSAKSGWISNQYAKKITASPNPATPSPAPKV